MSEPWIAGVDIGGTKISVTLGSVAGKIFKELAFSSLKGREPKRSIFEIESAIQALLDGADSKRCLGGIGIGIPGPVDAVKGIVERSPNLPAWKGLRLKSVLTRRFHVPVQIENDANAAACAEQLFGAGRGIANFLYLTISTGIGAGIVINGALVRGRSGSAGEIGHLTMVPGGLACPCGKRGCLEAYSSGTAIAGHVKRMLKSGKKSRFFKRFQLDEITGQVVSDAARKGDPVAIEARRIAADYLGIALANAINLLNPERIILGGGVMKAIHHFWAPMMRAVRHEAWPAPFHSCRIMRSGLHGRAGDLGALALGAQVYHRGSVQ